MTLRAQIQTKGRLVPQKVPGTLKAYNVHYGVLGVMIVHVLLEFVIRHTHLQRRNLFHCFTEDLPDLCFSRLKSELGNFELVLSQ